MAVLIANSQYTKLGGQDLTNVLANTEMVKAKLKTVLNFQDEDIKVLVDRKRFDVGKELGNIKSEIDEINEDGGSCLLFVYYAGRMLVVNEKKHTVHGAEVEKRSNFDLDGWLESLDDQAFVIGMFDCCRAND